MVSLEYTDKKPASGRLAQRTLFNYYTVGWLAASLDFFFIAALSVLSGIIYHFVVFSTVPDSEILLGVGIITAFLYLAMNSALQLYSLHALVAPSRYLPLAAFVWALSILIVALSLFLLKIGASYSRGSVLLFAIFGLLGTTVIRAAISKYVRRAIDAGTLLGRRVIVVGQSEEIKKLTKNDLIRIGTTEVGRFVVSNLDSPSIVRDRLNRILELSRTTNADEIVLVWNWKDRAGLEAVRRQVRLSPLRVRLLPDGEIAALLDPISNDRAALAVELQRAPLTPFERAQKRMFDILVSSILIVALLPLLLITAIAIRIDSNGPIIFQQRRKGFNGEVFTIFKFRTMTVMEDGTSVRQAKINDRRVTRLGRLLRRSSIDELPQLFNVLKGEMSLVGPRPHALAHDDEYGSAIGNYAFRHHVKPGITGWAQVQGSRGETILLRDMEKRIDYDLWYINNWTIWLDIRIAFRTCISVIGHPAAY